MLGTRFRLALKISWIFFSGIFFEYLSHESYNAKKLNFLELSHQGKHFGFENYQEQASKMPCGSFGTKPARAQAFISMSNSRSIIIGKEITLQPHLCQPCCHSFNNEDRIHNQNIGQLDLSAYTQKRCIRSFSKHGGAEA